MKILRLLEGHTTFYRKCIPKEFEIIPASTPHMGDLPPGRGSKHAKRTGLYRSGSLAAEGDLPLGGGQNAVKYDSIGPVVWTAEGDLRQFLRPGKNPLFRRLHIWGKTGQTLLNLPIFLLSPCLGSLGLLSLQ